MQHGCRSHLHTRALHKSWRSHPKAICCSGKWPDHPRAYAKAKAAMGCQLADELASGFGLHASASEHCIDVLADGFAFRIFLTSER